MIEQSGAASFEDDNIQANVVKGSALLGAIQSYVKTHTDSDGCQHSYPGSDPYRFVVGLSNADLINIAADNFQGAHASEGDLREWLDWAKATVELFQSRASMTGELSMGIVAIPLKLAPWRARKTQPETTRKLNGIKAIRDFYEFARDQFGHDQHLLEDLSGREEKITAAWEAMKREKEATRQKIGFGAKVTALLRWGS